MCAKKSSTRTPYDGSDELNKDRDAVGVLPKEFFIGLRCALESGMSFEQITSILVLSAGVHRATSTLDNELLLSKARYLAGLIDEDIDRMKSSGRHRS